MNNDFIRSVYYKSLTIIHKPVSYTPIDFTVTEKKSSMDGVGSGNGYGDVDGSG